MKKVLLAFDGTNFSEGAFTFARQLNEIQPLLLTGVFLPQIDIVNTWSYAGGLSGANYIPLLEEGEAELVQKNIQQFKSLCESNGIAYLVHKDFYDLALPELRKETRYADLVIISSEKFYEYLPTNNLNDSLRDALHQSECPVIVVPENYNFPDHIILTYDGSPSSVYALKQFAYLFPELSNKKTLLVYYSSSNEAHLPDERYIEELAAHHFGNLEIQKLQANPKKYFVQWASDHKNPIVVCGSFGRNAVSEMFHKSFITEVIGEHKIPVFIAHK